MKINFSGIVQTMNMTNDCKDVQLNVCNNFQSVILTPLYIAVILYLIRIFFIYKLDREKHPKMFSYGELGTDLGIIMCIIITIVWILITR